MRKISSFIVNNLLGWKVEGDVPTEDKYIFAVLPHTSNWDFVIGYLIKLSLGLELAVFAKDSFFVWPLSWVCKKLGVHPVNRRERTNLVDQIVQMYSDNDSFAVVITPEGTRSYRDELKSGYYHIATKADIPIVVAGLDYQKKVAFLLPARKVLPSFEEDVEQLMEFSRSIAAKNPEMTFT